MKRLNLFFIFHKMLTAFCILIETICMNLLYLQLSVWDFYQLRCSETDCYWLG